VSIVRVVVIEKERPKQGLNQLKVMYQTLIRTTSENTYPAEKPYVKPKGEIPKT